MCHDRRLTIIRAVMTALLALAILPWSFWAFYALTLVLFGLMMPVFGGTAECGTLNAACNSGTKPSTASVTFSGYVSSTTHCAANCTSRNATFVSTTTSEQTNGCSYIYNNFPCARDASGNNPLTTSIVFGATHTTISVAYQCLLGTNSTEWDDSTSFGASPLDCSSFGTVGPTISGLHQCGSTNDCDYTPVIVSVVFS